MSGARGPSQAVFLVGGLGTRLGALTQRTPKPLMDVAGRPFLDWLVQAVAGQGVRRLLFLSGYLAPLIEKASAAWAEQGLEVAFSEEPEPLGTGGALVLARPKLAETFYLLNGDSLFHIPLAALAEPEADGREDLARLALRMEADAERYGSVQLEGDRVVHFREKGPGAGLINGGVYWMRREVLDGAPAGAFSLERDLFPEIAAAGRLGGRVFDAPFIDIGLPASLEAAQAYVPAALSRPPG